MHRQALQWGQCNSIEAVKKRLDAPDCTPVAISNFLVPYSTNNFELLIFVHQKNKFKIDK